MGSLRKEGKSTDDSLLWNRSAVYPKVFGKTMAFVIKNFNHIYVLARKPKFSFEYYNKWIRNIGYHYKMTDN